MNDALTKSPSKRRPVAVGRWSSLQNLLFLGAWVLLLAAAVVACWLNQRRMSALALGLEGSRLREAERVLGAAIEQERTRALTAATVLAEDSRVRAGVLTPSFDAATTRDLLADLRPTTGASLLALLDPQGQVLAEAGAQSLRGADLGVTPVVQQAQREPATAVWTFPDRVLVVGLAPVRARADQAAALLVMAFEIGAERLRAIDQALGVSAALFVQNRLVAASFRDPERRAALQNAVGLADGEVHALESEPPLLVRFAPTSESAGAARVGWMLAGRAVGPGQKRGDVLVWLPVLLLAMALVLATTVEGRRPPALRADPGRS